MQQFRVVVVPASPPADQMQVQLFLELLGHQRVPDEVDELLDGLDDLDQHRTQGLLGGGCDFNGVEDA